MTFKKKKEKGEQVTKADFTKSYEKVKQHKFNFVPCDVCGRGLTMFESYMAVLIVLKIIILLIVFFAFITYHIGYIEGQGDVFLIQMIAESIATTG